MNLVAALKNAGVLDKIEVQGITAGQVADVFTFFNRPPDEALAEGWLMALRGSGFKGSVLEYLMSGSVLEVIRGVDPATMSVLDPLFRGYTALRKWLPTRVEEMTTDDWSEMLTQIGLDPRDDDGGRVHDRVQADGYQGSLGSFLSSGRVLMFFDQKKDGTYLKEPWECRFCHQPNFTGHDADPRVCGFCQQPNLN